VIGFAVREKCPDCRMVLDILSVRPDTTVLHQRSCHSRQCRGKPPLVFMIKDGHYRVLTAAQLERMVEAETQEGAVA